VASLAVVDLDVVDDADEVIATDRRRSAVKLAANAQRLVVVDVAEGLDVRLGGRPIDGDRDDVAGLGAGDRVILAIPDGRTSGLGGGDLMVIPE